MNINFVLFVLVAALGLVRAGYKLGVGIADVTGPVAEITFMGYGHMEQKGTGLHLRQWSRAFIIDDGVERIVFVSVDVGMMGDGVCLKVLEILQSMYGNTYNRQNVILSGTHTHSAPGGFMMDMLFDLPILGFSKETFRALVAGIVKSIAKAHDDIQDGKLFIARGELHDANINRSPHAYMENPEWERERFKQNVDTDLVQLKFVSTEGKPMGVINWFAVHPTSMNNTNTLVSSDNVGYASILFEMKMNPMRLLGRGPFVAAFASSNLGDVSPNIMGPKCQKSGQRCDMLSSACPSKFDSCIASGPGHDMFESTRIIAERLFGKGWELWTGENAEELTGPLKVVHQYVDMPKAETVIVNPRTGEKEKVHGCLPAMGYSFAAGTTDGPGAFSFQQGTTTANPLWNMLRDFLAEPTEADIRCHSPKPILLATGHMRFPLQWQPSIVSTQMALIGNVALACVPGEFTTMAGRRLRTTVANAMSSAGVTEPNVIIAGLCNTYSDYITTYEEYQIQRYEAASTIYGPHTLSLHLSQFKKLAEALMKNTPLDPGPKPEVVFNDLLSLITPVIYDTAKLGYSYGDTTLEPRKQARPGDIVIARFVSGNPRNDLKHGDTYCTVERQDGPDVWTVVYTDANWETKMRWIRTSDILGNSETECEWTVPNKVQPGVYRIRHFGTYKYIFGGLYPYEGTSLPCQVSPSGEVCMLRDRCTNPLLCSQRIPQN